MIKTIGTTLFCFALASFAIGSLFADPGGEPEFRSSPDPKLKALSGLKVGNDTDGYFEWDRSQAIEYGLGQLAKLVDYIFVATAALLGLVVKAFVFDRVNSKLDDTPKLDIWTKSFAAGSMLCCVASLLYGMLVYGMLPHFAVDTSYQVNTIAFYCWWQIAFFTSGLICVAVICVKRLFFH